MNKSDLIRKIGQSSSITPSLANQLICSMDELDVKKLAALEVLLDEAERAEAAFGAHSQHYLEKIAEIEGEFLNRAQAAAVSVMQKFEEELLALKSR
jgi:hypothetical protein